MTNMKSVYEIVTHISILSPLAGCVVFFIKKHSLSGHNFHILIYIITCLLADVVTYFKIFPASIVFNIKDILQFFIIYTVYANWLLRRFVWLLFFAMLSYCIGAIVTITFQGVNVYNAYLWSLSSGIISIFTLIYPESLIRTPERTRAYENEKSSLILNSSLSLYFLTTIFIFQLAPFFFEKMDHDILMLTWTCHNMANILKNTGIAIAFYLN